METGDILTSAQTIGFAIDHPVWHDRPDEQAALARIAERSGLGEYCAAPPSFSLFPPPPPNLLSVRPVF